MTTPYTDVRLLLHPRRLAYDVSDAQTVVEYLHGPVVQAAVIIHSAGTLLNNTLTSQLHKFARKPVDLPAGG